jgi:hypothetical protein
MAYGRRKGRGMPARTTEGGGNPRFAPRGPQQWAQRGSGNNMRGGRPAAGRDMNTGLPGGGQNRQQFGATMAPRGAQRFGQGGPGGEPAGGRDMNTGIPGGNQNRQQFGATMAPRGPQQFGQRPGTMPARSNQFGNMGTGGQGTLSHPPRWSRDINAGGQNPMPASGDNRGGFRRPRPRIMGTGMGFGNDDGNTY